MKIFKESPKSIMCCITVLIFSDALPNDPVVFFTRRNSPALVQENYAMIATGMMIGFLQKKSGNC